MVQLVLKGHPTRGEEVIEILEMFWIKLSHTINGRYNYRYGMEQ